MRGCRRPIPGWARESVTPKLKPTEADLARIERELAITLPPSYRAVMLDYPFDPTEFQELAGDIDDIIKENRRARSGNWFDAR